MASTSLPSRLLEPAPGLTRREHKIKSKDGTEISLWRIASSASPEGTPQPALIYAHGGAFILRNIDISTVDLARFNTHLTHRLGPDALHTLGCVMLSVSYRLATESPFPAPAEDVCAAYEYAREHADDLGILADEICIMGVSAGGNLAWAATHMALDQGLPAPCGLMALYPMLDPDTTWGKFKLLVGLGATSILRRGWDKYLAGLSHVPEPQQKYARLLQLPREDLAKLPPPTSIRFCRCSARRPRDIFDRRTRDPISATTGETRDAASAHASPSSPATDGEERTISITMTLGGQHRMVAVAPSAAKLREVDALWAAEQSARRPEQWRDQGRPNPACTSGHSAHSLPPASSSSSSLSCPSLLWPVTLTRHAAYMALSRKAERIGTW